MNLFQASLSHSPTSQKISFCMTFSSSLVRTDTAIVDSYKPPSQMPPCVHHPHTEFLDMKNSSDGFTHHIYERALPPPSTNPSRRATLKLFIIFFITFTSATLLQAVGYLLIVHSRLPSSPLLENQLPLPIVSHPARYHFILYTYVYLPAGR